MDFWSQFWATMWGALAGALVGGGVSALIAIGTARHARRLAEESRQLDHLSSYEKQLVAALSGLMAEMGLRAAVLERWVDDVDRTVPGWARLIEDRAKSKVGLPSDAALQVQADIACMVAHGSDLEVLRAIADLLWAFKETTARWQQVHLGALVGSIRYWQNGDKGAQDLIDETREQIAHIQSLAD